MPVPTLKSRNNCCVVGCNNTYKNSPDTKFYGFPAKFYETERRAVWVRLVRRCKWVAFFIFQLTSRFMLCEIISSNVLFLAPMERLGPLPRIPKFVANIFLGNEKRNEQAHPSYNPSIFPSPYKKSVVLGVAERHDRWLPHFLCFCSFYLLLVCQSGIYLKFAVATFRRACTTGAWVSSMLSYVCLRKTGARSSQVCGRGTRSNVVIVI